MDRAVQGRTRPFLCRADDGHSYYVKGKAAGRRSLICEWVAGALAREFGLGLPEFRVAIAPAALLSLHPEGSDLGASPAFASRVVAHAAELGFAHIGDVDRAVRRDIAVFDWWVRNEDRSLTAHGGNPNLLWDPSDKALTPIDHNLAFDDDFDPQRFLDTHVFSADFADVTRDLAERGVYAGRLKEAFSVAQQAWDEMPLEWHYHDDECTVPVAFDIAEAVKTLMSCATETFWRAQ